MKFVDITNQYELTTTQIARTIQARYYKSLPIRRGECSGVLYEFPIIMCRSGGIRTLNDNTPTLCSRDHKGVPESQYIAGVGYELHPEDEHTVKVKVATRGGTALLEKEKIQSITHSQIQKREGEESESG